VTTVTRDFARVMVTLEDADDNSSFAAQEKSWKAFVSNLDSIEAVNLIAQEKPRLHRYLFGAHKQW
jgi:hypothetical protein